MESAPRLIGVVDLQNTIKQNKKCEESGAELAAANAKKNTRRWPRTWWKIRDEGNLIDAASRELGRVLFARN